MVMQPLARETDNPSRRLRPSYREGRDASTTGALAATTRLCDRPVVSKARGGVTLTRRNGNAALLPTPCASASPRLEDLRHSGIPVATSGL